MPRYMLLHKCRHCQAVDLFTFHQPEPIAKEFNVRTIQPPAEGMGVTDGSEEEAVSETPAEKTMVQASRAILLD